jgi:hypothetical protein
MKRRKSLMTVIAALATAVGLVLPGTAAARSFSCPAYNPAVSVSVTVGGDAAVDVVSWGD